MNIIQSIVPYLPKPVQNWKEKRYYGRYGEIELHLLEFLCDRERDAIDVGANNGCYVHFMRPHSKRVIGFEPYPPFIRMLTDKFRGKAVIEPIALSNSVGETVLRVPVENGKDVTGCSTIDAMASSFYTDWREIKVTMDKLDNVYKGNVGFIKIDVEGHEYAVLEGAIETIRRCQPRVLVELVEHLGDGCIAKACEFFSRLSYRGFYVHNGALHPISTFNIREMQNPMNMPDLHASLKERPRFPKYIYNFIFLPWNEPIRTIEQMDERLERMFS